MSEQDPHAEYDRREAAANEDADHWRQRERWLSRLRLLAFVALLATLWFAFGSRQIERVYSAVPAVAFIALLVLHDRVIQRRMRAERTAAIYSQGTARLEDRWAGRGIKGDRWKEAGHPYADDLDLFGDASLFELLCTARTPAGEGRLARWLTHPSPVAEAIERQASVRELRDRLDLREDLALLGEDVTSRLDPRAMVEWGEAETVAFTSALRLITLALAALAVAALASWIALGTGPIPFVVALAVEAIFVRLQAKRVDPILKAVGRPTRDLRLLGGLLARLEVEPVESPTLVRIRDALMTDGEPPSRRIAQLQRLVDLLDARGNQFFAPIGALLMWGTQVTMAIEDWRSRYGPTLTLWLDAAAEFEAICSISGYAYEHPADTFPVLVAGAPTFDGVQIGHPLLANDACVRNDLFLDSTHQALLMSGSNMSGKSTMLRTVGINTVLALAGAPVRAASLTVSPLAIAASIRVVDSLQDGTSHFYAEIKRLRQVVDIASSDVPAIFLLDEILHGTNSHDRRIGAEAVIRGLLDRGALGIVTTHDLALTHIAEELAPQIENVHFQDHLEDGRMTFDYALQPGIVTKSNALELMRSVGLDV